VQDLQLLLSEPSAGVLEMKLAGEVDMATVDPLREATKTAASSGEYDTLLFDLTGLTFIDSTGLHTLTEANRSMVARGGRVQIVCAPGNLMKVFQLTGLDQIFPIVHSRAEAFSIAA